MKIETRKLSELVFDFDLYPRTQIDSKHVSDMAKADAAGTSFPPYVIDAASNRVVDGFHRGKKDARVHGPDCEVECEVWDYKSEKEIFLDAMQRNAGHGRKLTDFDRARCALKCRKYKLGMKTIAAALHITPADLKAIGEGRVAKVTDGEDKSGPRTSEVALKQTIRHKAGQTLTPDQEAANDRLSGMNQSFYANQLLILLRSELIDTADEKLMDVLTQLHGELETLLVAGGPVA